MRGLSLFGFFFEVLDVMSRMDTNEMCRYILDQTTRQARS